MKEPSRASLHPSAEHKNHTIFAGGYAVNDTSWPELQQAILRPGNMLCGGVPPGFPAYVSNGQYLTGSSQSPLVDLGRECSVEDEAVINPDYYGDHSGDSLSEAAIAGKRERAAFTSKYPHFFVGPLQPL